MRFDLPKTHVNMALSTGVLGYFQYQGSLYVHLDETQTHDIFLQDVAGLKPYLWQSNTDVLSAEINPRGTEISYNTFARGITTSQWRGMVANQDYRLSWKSDGVSKTELVHSNASGELRYTLKLNGKSRVELVAQ